MIDFKPIRLEDRATIERYTFRADNPNCDLAFANMYCWQGVYRSAWAEAEGFLVIRFHIDGGTRIAYMQPLGEGDFTRILPLLEEDARSHGQPLRLAGLTPEARTAIRGRMAGEFAFDADRAARDYIYDAEELRNLTGRRFQPKRNHINRFIAEYPDYRYEELTPERFDECMKLEREWRRAHEGHQSELCAEQHAIQRAFRHFGELGLRGGCIYVGDRLAAFTYGSAVTERVFDTHIEKADTRYDGAFTIINKLFARHLPPEFRFINREEDLGIEGLRRAKLSYHPAELLPKIAALRLDEEQIACKRLWTEVFGDEEEFVDRFLMRYYAPERTIALHDGERLAAMLHLIPFECEAGRALYLYGVATDPAYRRQGFAARLMEEALRRIDAGDADIALLIPSPGQEWLREFYARYGFEGEIPLRFDAPEDFDFGTGDPAADRAMVRRRTAATPLPEELTARYADRL